MSERSSAFLGRIVPLVLEPNWNLDVMFVPKYESKRVAKVLIDAFMLELSTEDNTRLLAVLARWVFTLIGWVANNEKKGNSKLYRLNGI